MSVVLLKDEYLSAFKWRMAKVFKVLRGKDEMTCVAEISNLAIL